MFQKFVSCVAALNRFGRTSAGVGLLVMTGLVTADVILRRLFNSPIIFADEVSGYLLVLVTMMGLGYTLQEDAHIQVTMIFKAISPTRRTFLKLGLCIIGIFYTVILLYLTGQLTWESYSLKAFAPTPSQTPLFPFQIAMPIGCAFFLFQMIIEIINTALSIWTPKPLNSQKD